ncbi:hypothetical protein HZF04_13035, partial [Sphingomonas sp. CGMCC 1.13658]|nr:hypothetical protein [Sphingomonas sp. CGMCC 1.13658]
NGGADTLMGGLGRDKLTGGEGNDVFVFGSGDGQDLITDFNGGGAGDIIQLTGLGLSSFADVQANASQLGADTVIQLGSGQTLTLQHFNLASLSAYDFQFG